MREARVEEIPIDLIDPDPNQPRKTFSEAELRGLGQTLALGQVDPVHVRQLGNRYQLIHGGRRLLAAKQIGFTTLLAMVVDGPGADPAELLEEQLISNIQWEELNPIDTAKAIDRLMTLQGKPAGAVANRLGMSSAMVSKLLALLLLPENVQQKIASGELAASTAYEIARVSDGAERAKLAAEAVSDGLTRDSVVAKAKLIGKSKRSRQRLKARLRRLRVVFPLGADRSVTVSGVELTTDNVVSWIGELFAALTHANANGLALADVVQSFSTSK